MRIALLSLSVLVFALSGCVTNERDTLEGIHNRTVVLGETARFSNITAMPIRIAEDSRCAAGVQCIQAGTVRIEARLAAGTNRRDAILALGVPERLGNGWVSLVRVCPYPRHGWPIQPGDYRFTLVLTTNDTPPLIDAAGCNPRIPR
jgi:hypothetical protein